MILTRERSTPVEEKKINISLNGKNEKLLLQSFYMSHKKSGDIKGNVYIELTNVEDLNKRKLSDEVLMRLEIPVESGNKKEALRLHKGFLDNLMKIINKDMSESLEQKMFKIEAFLERQKEKFEDPKNGYMVNPKYKAKKEAPKQEYKGNNNKNYNGKKDGESFTDKFNRIPVAYIIRRLEELDIIKFEEPPSKNGDETFYRIMLPDGSSSKTSTLSIESIESGNPETKSKYKHLRDLNNSKLTCSTARGFLYKLKDVGIISDVFETTQKLVENGFKDYPLVDEKNDKVELGEGGNVIDIVNLRLASRYPSLHGTKKQADYKRYLIEKRGIAEDIVEREFHSKNIATGTFASSKNYIESSVGLFALKYFGNNYNKSFEKFKFENKEQTKLNRTHLQAIELRGRAHLIEKENAKATIFTEAVIDNYSMEEIIRSSSNFNHEEYNYVALTSVGNIQQWLEYNVNVKIDFKVNKDTGELETRMDYIKNYTDPHENQEEEMQKLAKAIKTKRVHFIVDEKSTYMKKSTEQALFKIQKVLNKIDPEISVHVTRLTKENFKIDYEQFDNGDQAVDFILDKTNVDDFLRKNNIEYKYNKEEKDYDVQIVKQKVDFVPIKENPELIEKVKNDIIELTGNDNFIFSFDNDTAALSKVPHLANFCKTIGINYSVTVPTFSMNINDNNDILKAYKDLLNKSQKEKAFQLIESFTNQINRTNSLPNNFEEIYKHAEKIDKEKSLNKKKEKVRSKKPR